MYVRGGVVRVAAQTERGLGKWQPWGRRSVKGDDGGGGHRHARGLWP